MMVCMTKKLFRKEKKIFHYSLSQHDLNNTMFEKYFNVYSNKGHVKRKNLLGIGIWVPSR